MDEILQYYKNCSAAQKWQQDLWGDWNTISLDSRKMSKMSKCLENEPQSIWQVMQINLEVEFFPKWRILLLIIKFYRHGILIYLSVSLCPRWGLISSCSWYQLLNCSLSGSGSLELVICTGTAHRTICCLESQIITPSLIYDNTLTAPVPAMCRLLDATV